MIKMIALDLDNTLLNSQKEISPANEATLKRLHQAGVKVVLCTGRPINAIGNYIDQLGLHEATDFTITFNGGLVINNQTREPLFTLGMTKRDWLPVYDFLQSRDLPMDVLDFDRVYELQELGPSRYRQTVKGIEFVDTDLAGVPGDDHRFAKVILAADPAKVTAAKAAIPATITDHLTVVQSQPHILEFLPQGVNKMLGLNHLLAHFDWTAENLMAFGDADNDLEMIQGAGDGVAMGNSLDSILAVADHTTKTNDEDGVAAYLEQAAASFDLK